MFDKQILTGGGQNAAHKFRDERIDSVKYFLIILVILGHVFIIDEYSVVPECITAKKWIYLFHMPLFIFISGYFSNKKEKKAFLPSILKLLEPLLIYHIIFLLLDIIIKGKTITWIDALTPWGLLWYLLSLIYWRMMIQFTPNKILNNKKLVLIGTFCISIIAGFLPFDRFLSIQRTLAFMPFFFLGYYMKGQKLFLPNKYKPLCFIFLFLTFSIPIFFSQYLGSLAHCFPYSSYDDAFKRMLVFCFSIPMSIAFINICPTKPWFAKQGKLTLQYYIYHPIITIPMTIITIMLNIPFSFITAIIFAITLTIILGIASYVPYFSKFTNPSSFFKT